ncbi:hypothetical protein ACWIGI_34735 [Nocardia sp. NPDC055321]
MPAATVYTCRVTNWPMVWLTLLVVVLQVFIGLTDRTVASVVIVAIWTFALVQTVLESSQRVSTGPAGVSVHRGLFGFPRLTLARDDIADAETIHYAQPQVRECIRRLWTRERRSFLAPASGPALRLRLHSGRDITVSVKDPFAALWALGITPQKP